MSDITLKSGKVVTIDVSQMTVKQYREFTNSNGATDAEDVLIAKCTGLTVPELEEMPYTDSRVIIRAILKAANQPMLDPN